MTKSVPDTLIQQGTAVLLRSPEHPPAAVFFRGLSGSGRSDLAFRLIERGHKLICDDQVSFTNRKGEIYAGAVEANAGLLEVRGVGLVKYPYEVVPHPLRLIVDLVRRDDVPRMPDWNTTDILGVAIPTLALHAFDASVAVKVTKAMEIAHKPDLRV